MKYMNYDKKTGIILGFYEKDIHGDDIPTGCIMITDEIWSELLNRQGEYIVDITKASAIVIGTEITVLEELLTELTDAEKEILFPSAPVEPTEMEKLLDTLILDNLNIQSQIDTLVISML